MSSITKSSPSRTRVAFDPAWKTILECAAVEVFEMMAGVRPELNPPAPETRRRANRHGWHGRRTLRHDHTSVAPKRPPPDLPPSCSANLLPPIPPSSGDALGELCNMVAGNFKSKISTLGRPLHALRSHRYHRRGLLPWKPRNPPKSSSYLSCSRACRCGFPSSSTPSRNIRPAASARNSSVGAGLVYPESRRARPAPTHARFKLHVASRAPWFFRYSWY